MKGTIIVLDCPLFWRTFDNRKAFDLNLPSRLGNTAGIQEKPIPNFLTSNLMRVTKQCDRGIGLLRLQP